MAPRSKRDWQTDLRAGIKTDNGIGWSVREHRNGHVQLTRIYPDRTRSACYLPISWAQENSLEIRNWVARVAQLMHERAISLSKAVELRRAFENAGGVQGASEQAFTQEGWELAAEGFLATLGANRPTTLNDTKLRVQKALLTLAAKPKPKSGEEVLRRYAALHFHDQNGTVIVAPGKNGRKRGLEDVERFLRFAVNRRGAPTRFLPPADPLVKQELIGKADLSTAEELTLPIKPEEVSAFLDWLQENNKPELRLAVGLVAYYGLRKAELGVLRPENGRLYVGMNVKENARTKSKGERKARLAGALAIEGRPANEAADMLAQLESGLVKLPKAIRNQIDMVPKKGHFQDVGDTFGQMVRRTGWWKQFKQRNPEITENSFRHGWAWRAHCCSGSGSMPIRVAAAMLGHSTTTHQRFYGAWVDEPTLEAELERFNAGVATC